MKLARPVVRPRAALVAAWLLACNLAPAVAAVRSPCVPRPAAGDVKSQAADALSLSLDAAHPAALANWDADRWQRHRV